MKLSKYISFIKLNDDRMVLFNTFNGKLIMVENSVAEKIKNEVTDEMIMEYFGKYADFVKTNFCVEKEEDKEKLRQWLINSQSNKDRLTVTILTTQACNLACVYCYQRGIIDRKLHMNSDVAYAVQEWTINKIKENEPKEVIFHFYGGEPLLNLDVLDTIMPEIIRVSEESGARFSSYITTNGTLLSHDNIQRLKKWKLDNAQISIDGPSQTHNERRPYFDGSGSFENIMQNVKTALEEKLNIVIRVNLDKHNTDKVEDLFKEMRSRGFHEYDNLQINLEIVSPIMNPSEHCKRYTFLEDDELSVLVEMWKRQVEYGFPIKSIMPIDSACENLVENSYTISSTGDFYMCPGFVGIKESILGNVLDKGIDSEMYMKLLNNRAWEQCLDCEYVPVCQGGCKMCAYVVHKKYGVPYCRKDFVSKVYPKFIESKYGDILQ